MSAVVELRNVSKSFVVPKERFSSLRDRLVSIARSGWGNSRRLDVLKDISVSFSRGECVGILGRNGSGKSTMLKILAGVLVPDSGSVEVEGTISPFLELGVGFNHELTVRDNVYLYGAVLGLSEREIDDKFDSIIAYAELGDFVDAKLRTLSSGMQVRAAFSVAITVDTAIYLADEVLAVGDARFQEKCHASFRDLRQRQKTILYVSHALGTIEQFCDRAIWIADGRIAADGRPADVIPRYLEAQHLAPSPPPPTPRAAPIVRVARVEELPSADGGCRRVRVHWDLEPGDGSPPREGFSDERVLPPGAS